MHDTACFSKCFRRMSLPLLLAACTLCAAGDLEENLLSQGLINVHKLDPSILVDLKYSTADNFLHADVYGDLEKCYLYPVPALRLALAQQLLQAECPGFSLLVYDSARPRSVQRRMWDVVKGTDMEEYVANPDSGSIHNFGAAVDLTIVDEQGRPLDMGTEFDFFGDLARPDSEERFLSEGRLTRVQYVNRLLLRNIMRNSGFREIVEEWWHFESVSKMPVRKMYRIIE
ncbi:MAG: M15 family metallopeptidase [Candidatus Wallbacteria bacterium]|nr:M15 family metallopeptidase [Candidatus Wallbacteria bacterium]